MENVPQATVQICHALEASFSVDNEKRKQAEEFLTSLSLNPLTPSLLVTIISNEPIAGYLGPPQEEDGPICSTVRLAAGIFLKNEIKKHWAAAKENPCYGPEAKQLFYERIFALLVKYVDERSMREMILECCRLAITTDFPAKCPGFATQAFDAITQRSNVKLTTAGLLLLKSILSKYEYRAIEDSDRLLLEELTVKFFGPMLHLVKDIAEAPGGIFASDDTCVIVKLIIKIHWTCTQIALAKGGEVLGTFDMWMEVFHLVIETDLPPRCNVVLAEDKQSLQPLKTKKWAYQSIHRLLSRHASSSSTTGQCADEFDAKLGQLFLQRWAVSSLKLVIEQLLSAQKGTIYLGPRLQNLSLQIATKAIELSALYKVLKPYVRQILFDVCYSFLCYNKDDIEAWITDPSEYLRRSNDVLKVFQSPREAAAEFLKLLCRLRGRDWLEEVVKFAHSVLAECQASQPSSGPGEFSARIDGALLMVGSIADRLANRNRQLMIEPFIINFVFPQLSSADPMLRYRALHTVAAFLDDENDRPCPIQSVENLTRLFQRVFELTKDQELPIRAQAGNTLSCFFRFEALKPLVTSYLPALMETIFSLLSEFDSEIIVGSLESLVLQYEDHVPVYAERLVGCLAQHMVRLMDGQSLDIDDDSFMTAMSLSQTILTVLQALADSGLKKEWASLEVILMPLLRKVLVPEQITYIEDGLQMAAYLTYYTPEIPREAWFIFERLYSALCGGSFDHLQLTGGTSESWAPDYFFKMISVFDNFISRDKETFLNGRTQFLDKTPVSYLDMTIKIIQHMLHMDNTFVPEAHRHSVELLSVVFEAFVDDRRIDHLMDGSIDLIWNYYSTNQRVGVRTLSMLTRCFCVMMLYSGQLFFESLAKRQITDQVLSLFLQADKCHNIDARRTTILGICFILNNIDQPYVPDSIRQGLPALCAAAARIFHGFLKMRAQAEDNAGRDFRDEDSEQELDEDDNAAADAHESLLEKLRNTAMDWEDSDEDMFPDDFDGTFECCTDSNNRFSVLVTYDETSILAQCVSARAAQFQAALGADYPAFHEALLTAVKAKQQ